MNAGQGGGKATSGFSGVLSAGVNITTGVPYSTMYPCMNRCRSNSVEKSMFVIASTAVTLIYIHNVCGQHLQESDLP